MQQHCYVTTLVHAMLRPSHAICLRPPSRSPQVTSARIPGNTRPLAWMIPAPVIDDARSHHSGCSARCLPPLDQWRVVDSRQRGYSGRNVCNPLIPPCIFPISQVPRSRSSHPNEAAIVISVMEHEHPRGSGGRVKIVEGAMPKVAQELLLHPKRTWKLASLVIQIAGLLVGALATELAAVIPVHLSKFVQRQTRSLQGTITRQLANLRLVTLPLFLGENGTCITSGSTPVCTLSLTR